ncbi:siderophore-interacting protein [Paracoccaceae bacterium GXU_MW_L88]
MAQTTALLDIPFDTLAAFIHREAGANMLPVAAGEARVTIATLIGEIVATPGRLEITAEDPDDLHVLREFISENLVDLAGDLRWSHLDAGRPPPNLHILTVASCRRICPAYHRLRLTGDVTRYRSTAYHVRLVPPGTGAQRWPVVAATGKTVWAEGSALPHRPVYTIIAVGADWIEIDIFIHEGGRSCTWAAGLSPGDEVGLTGPGGSGAPAHPNWALFADETALPAVLRMLEERPDSTGRATLLVPSAASIREIRHPQITIDWRVRARGHTLLDALEDHPPSAWDYIFFCGEKHEVAEARARMKAAGHSPKQQALAAYWTAPATSPAKGD